MTTVVPALSRRKTRAESDLEAAFGEIGGDLAGDFTARATAFARFEGAGLPHRRVEPYHFTDLRSMLAAAPRPAAKSDVAPVAGSDLFAPLAAARAVFVDGWFRAELSDLSGLGAGVAVTTVARGLETGEGLARLGARIAADPAIEADPLVALAAAFFTDGLIVTLAPGAAMARPLEIRHLSSGTAVSAFVRHAVTVGEGASAEIFEKIGRAHV